MLIDRAKFMIRTGGDVTAALADLALASKLNPKDPTPRIMRIERVVYFSREATTKAALIPYLDEVESIIRDYPGNAEAARAKDAVIAKMHLLK